MKKHSAILLMLALLCFAGCESTKHKGERTTNHKELYGRVLTLPDNGKWYVEGRDTTINIAGNLKIVTYYDSQGCVPCKLK